MVRASLTYPVVVFGSAGKYWLAILLHRSRRVKDDLPVVLGVTVALEVVAIGAESVHERALIRYAVLLLSKRYSVGVVATCGSAGTSRVCVTSVWSCKRASVRPNQNRIWAGRCF